MTDREMNYSNIEYCLLAAIPEFEASCHDALSKYASGLPHSVFGLLTAFIVQEYQKGSVGPGTPFNRSMQFLEEAIGSNDAELQNLVWVSFLENLESHAEKDYEGIKAKLGPKLRITLNKLA